MPVSGSSIFSQEPKKEGSTGKEEQLPEEKYSDSGRKWCDFPFSSVEESLIYATIVLASLQPCSLSVHFLREHERESEGTCSIPVGLLSGVLCSSSFAAFTPKCGHLWAIYTKNNGVRGGAGSSGWSPVYVEDNLAIHHVHRLSSPDDAVIWRGPKKNGMIKEFLRDVDWGEVDYLIIDMPPGTSDERLSIVRYLSGTGIDGAVIITTTQEVSLQDVRKEIRFCKKVKIPIIAVIENMSGFVCPKCKADTFNSD